MDSARISRTTFVVTAASLLAAALAAASPAAADPRYVTPGGATSGECRPANPGDFYSPCDLEHALSVSADGDEVIVDPGDYTMSSAVTEADNVTIRGIPGQPRPHVTMGSNGDGQLSLTDLQGGGVRHLEMDGALRIFGNDKFAEDMVIRGALRLLGDTLVRDTLVSAPFIALDASSGTHELRNVTAVGTDPGSTGLLVRSENPPTCASAHVTAKNVIARGEAHDLSTLTTCPQVFVQIELSYSNYRDETVDGFGDIDRGNNQTNTPPVFVNAAAGDYHQAPTSPTIDGGTTDALLGTADIDGEPRMLGQAPDIGADESPVSDLDGDGVFDPGDNCRSIPNPDQADHEKDGQGDPCDPDDDNDGIADELDSCPLDPSADHRDTDGDGLHNPCDPDDDGDGVPDAADAFPLDPERSALTVRCAGKRATIVGTNGRDRVRGTRRRDVIAALGGNDVVSGLGGNDLICGGSGRDKISGGKGRDQLRGDAGNDRLLGGSGRDRLIGGRGRDLLRGGPGRDFERQ